MSVDPIAEVLDALTLQSSLISVAHLTTPFGVSCRATEAAIFHAVVQGRCAVEADGERVELRAGDLAVLTRGAAHVVSDRPGRTTRPIRSLPLATRRGALPRVRYGGGGAVCEVICGSFRLQHHDAQQGLMRLLPAVWVVRGDEVPLARWLHTNLELLDGEVGRESPAGVDTVRRLVDLLFVKALRTWLAAHDTRGEGWPSGLRDDRIARALALIHSRPAGAWTVDDLARHAGMSRSRFHRRFRELVGETPARYLVSWRMERAAALLGDERLSVAEVGQKVGYSAEDSFVRAFRRVHDCSPSQFRRHQLAG